MGSSVPGAGGLRARRRRSLGVEVGAERPTDPRQAVNTRRGRVMKALPRTAIRRPVASGFVLGRLRPGYEDFALFAILSDTVAVVLASVVAGGTYHWISFGKVT